MVFFGDSDVGRARSENQDSFFCKQLDANDFLAVVCDGMGGLLNGKRASSLAVSIFTKEVSSYLKKYEKTLGRASALSEEKIRSLLSDAVGSANHAIRMESMSGRSSAEMGTTLASVLNVGKKTYICHVGDSRVYVMMGGRLYRATKDHSLVQYLVDRGEISAAEAIDHPKKNVITRAIGTSDGVLPDISVIRTSDAECFLICSDGLTNHVSDKELENMISDASSDLGEKVSSLIGLANERGGKDNITAVMIAPESPDNGKRKK